METNVNKFMTINKCDGGIVRFGDNTPCPIKRKDSVTLDGQNNTDDVLFVEQLKHNLFECWKVE